ncbi:MAG: VWA domain-containing protein [Holophagales bacterium]|nr:VWA domain-containing protein [Holophagales bacterium]
MLTVLIFGSLVPAAPASAKDGGKKGHKAQQAAIEALPERFRQWLRDVEPIISEEELELFLSLDKDYQRDAFIERFWKVRDPYPRSTRNEYRESYHERLRQARTAFGELHDERTQVLLTNGFPVSRIEVNCKPYLSPIEVWYYDGSDNMLGEFLLLFYQKWGAGRFRLWQPFDGLSELALESRSVSRAGIDQRCRIRDAEAVITAISYLNSQGSMGAGVLLARVQKQPTAPQKEWVATFATYTTELPEEAATFDAELRLDFPGRNQSRTVVQGTVVVRSSDLAAVEMGSGLSRSYNLSMVGEVLKDGTLFDTFRYQFDFPAPGAPGGSAAEGVASNPEDGADGQAGSAEGTPASSAGESSGVASVVGSEGEASGSAEVSESPAVRLPLVFQRYLRPGTYELLIRLKDLGSEAYHRTSRTLEVPQLEREPPPPMDPETARILEEANAAIRSGETSIQILPLMGEWQTGLVRIDTMALGPSLDRVTFFLDDRPVLTKKSPPYDVELDLGDVPRSRVLRVEAEDSDGEVVASDEMMINSGDHRFDVRLEEPRPGRTYRHSLRAEANVVVPKGEVVERVELYLNDDKVATLYQPPWVHPIVLPELGEIAYVRAVAYTPSGTMTEDLVFVNAPANLEEIDVEFVELYTLVLDRGNRPVLGLERDDFAVFEDDVPQDMVRFELVRNLPIHAAILLDTSASMQDRLSQARDAALRFFEQAITPRDRATTITFNDHPNLTADFTNDLEALASGLAGLEAERGTALYDALIYSLYYFNGIKGQRAILLLSDGQDESSRFEFDDVLEFARRAGVSIYTIGLQLSRRHLDARRKLSRLSEETGGRSFFLEDVAELDGIYATIQEELRSRYLLAYQSNNTSGSDAFRSIEVSVDSPGAEAKTLRGYYP